MRIASHAWSLLTITLTSLLLIACGGGGGGSNSDSAYTGNASNSTFIVSEQNHGRSLWITDGTATHKLAKNIDNSKGKALLDGQLVYSTGSALMITNNGLAPKAISLTGIVNTSTSDLIIYVNTQAGGFVYFSAGIPTVSGNSTSYSYALWRTDGTAIEQIYEGDTSQHTAFGTKLIFVKSDDQKISSVDNDSTVITDYSINTNQTSKQPYSDVRSIVVIDDVAYVATYGFSLSRVHKITHANDSMDLLDDFSHAGNPYPVLADIDGVLHIHQGTNLINPNGHITSNNGGEHPSAQRGMLFSSRANTAQVFTNPITSGIGNTSHIPTTLYSANTTTTFSFEYVSDTVFIFENASNGVLIASDLEGKHVVLDNHESCPSSFNVGGSDASNIYLMSDYKVYKTTGIQIANGEASISCTLLTDDSASKPTNT